MIWPDGNARRFRLKRPYWNDDLTGQWVTITKLETAFLKSNGIMRTRRKLRQEFVVARKIFDKLLQKIYRDYNRCLLSRIEEVIRIVRENLGGILKHWAPGKTKKSNQS